jgi:DNA-3-methyladenine glycosylase
LKIKSQRLNPEINNNSGMDISCLKLNRNFYKREVLLVARSLLGKILVKNNNNMLLKGKIVEVEAYDGRTDEAAHTFPGKTNRNQIMFNEGGYFYVYFTYGAHFCCNVVTGFEGEGTAVLIRALEPIEGLKQMALYRYGKPDILNKKELYNLTSGPGKICQAFDIDRKEYGLDLTGDKIYLLNNEDIPVDKVIVTKRVGIKKSADLPWRFYIKDNPFISRK